MKIDELKYTLGGELIVTEPREVRLGRRDLSRMIVVDRKNQTITDSFVRKLPDYFEAGDVLVLNNSKRVPGVLKGNIIKNNAQVELLFINLGKNDFALCRIYPTHHITIGSKIKFGQDMIEVVKEGQTKYNLYVIHTITGTLKDILKRNGYAINTVYSSKEWTVDHLNPFYSTIEGSVESPLAGLHFTPELFKAFEAKGVIITYITLHSSGSWLPFTAENIEDHNVQGEEFEITGKTAQNINQAKSKGKKVVACGSTAMRTVETASDLNGTVHPQKGESKLYITPGYKFKIIDHYFTNFHQYKTSLMVLDAAFCGKQFLLKAYEEAKKRAYLFYEFGDAIFYL